MRLALLVGAAAVILWLSSAVSGRPAADLPCVNAGPLIVDNQQVVPYVQECPPPL